MNEGEGIALAIQNVSRTATMSADKASHCDTLHNVWMVDCVSHSEIYSDHGKRTKMAESYFSRLRRMVEGQHRHVSPQYLTSAQTTQHGLRTTAAPTTALWPMCRCQTRWMRLSAATGSYWQRAT